VEDLEIAQRTTLYGLAQLVALLRMLLSHLSLWSPFFYVVFTANCQIKFLNRPFSTTSRCIEVPLIG
jgi:hypothetical protein